MRKHTYGLSSIQCYRGNCPSNRICSNNVGQCIHDKISGAIGRASMTATLDSDCSEAAIGMKIAHDMLAMTDNTTQNVES